MVDIPEYDNYKFDLELQQAYNIKRNKYIKNRINHYGYHTLELQQNKKRKTIYLHKLVYICNNPTEDLINFEIDHIDCDKNNNKINNLRKCSASNNCSNKKTRIDNKLGIKYITETECGYRFNLVKNKISYNKRFKNLQDAIEYRDIKVKEICGEFANLG